MQCPNAKWYMYNVGKTFNKISLKFVPNGPNDSKPALVYIMNWRQKGDKPLSETMLARFTDSYMRHYGEMRWLKTELQLFVHTGGL